MSSLIRHVYGEDCSVLIEQFGLMATFNRALDKFTAEYAASLNQAPVVTERKPVTRDVEINKAQPEAEPAPVLDLTPPQPVSEQRVANDPRERRRLAKQAAEQALEQAKQAKSEAPIAETEATVVATETVTQPSTEVVVTDVEETLLAKAEQEVAPDVAAEPVVLAESTQTEVVATEETPEANETAEDKATADKDKPVRAPRRPRGRPPKKANSAPDV